MRLTLKVERMAYGADAIAHDVDGRTVFVSGGVPGDTVSAIVTEDRGSFARARVEKVVSPSDRRVKAPCPYVDLCGGCPWAHLDYQAQLEAKRANVVDTLTRIGHYPAETAERLVQPCVAPSDPWGYRNKVELGVKLAYGRTIIGMHDITGKGLVKVKSCALLSPRYAKLTKSVTGALSYMAGTRSLGLDRVGIRASVRTGEVEVALWGEPGPFPRAQVAKVLGDAAKLSSIVRVMTKGPQKARKIAGLERLAGHGNWCEQVGQERMWLYAPSFFQVNTKGAETLVRLVMDGLEPTEDDVAMDLYSGAGTFTLPLARVCNWVDAVESYGPAVQNLRYNLQHANLDNADPIGGDADLEFPDSDADIIVVDPPRAGLAENVVRKLSDQPARAIAYVSCDPATLARDLDRFEKIGVFSPVSVTPVDLFPQTFHVENVTILRR